MKTTRFALIVGLLSLIGLLPSELRAQQGAATSEFKIGIGVKASTLGAGVEVALPIFSKLNVRGGFNGLDYNHTFSQDGIHYAGTLTMRSGEASLDWFPFGGKFHLSPGLLVYNGNEVNANASVPGGQSFTLNGTAYTSNPNNPFVGGATVNFWKAAPAFKVGFGNLVPRGRRHWSFLAEAGVAYEGAPRATLAFAGSVCDSNGANCVNAAQDPMVQANVQAEQTKVNNKLSFFQVYPILSVGVGYSF